MAQEATSRRRYDLDDWDEVVEAARDVAKGLAVAQAFANFYVIVSNTDAETVRRMNLLKGRPADQPGSVTTTPLRSPMLYDFDRLPQGLTVHTVLGLMDDFFQLGPFGFRGPAAAHIPDQCTAMDGDVRTVQLIAPGYACPSNKFLVQAMDETGGDLLYITSANISRHRTGAKDEPAHWRAAGLERDFGAEAEFALLRQSDEDAVQASYPLHEPTSTTLLSIHELGPPDDDGRPQLIVERHGSLHVDEVREVAATHGYGVMLGPNAPRRLATRVYED